MGCWMYAMLACWIVWLLALWCGRHMRAAFPIIDPRLVEQQGERAANPETGV